MTERAEAAAGTLLTPAGVEGTAPVPSGRLWALSARRLARNRNVVVGAAMLSVVVAAALLAAVAVAGIAITTIVAITAPSRKYLTRMIVGSGADGAAAAQNSVIGIRLEGNGLKRSPRDWTGPGQGVTVATGNVRSDPAVVTKPLNWLVNGGQPINVVAQFMGTGDVDYEVGVTLEFDDTPYKGEPAPTGSRETLAFESNITAVDASTALSGSWGFDTAPNRVVPDGMSHIAAIDVGVAVDHAGAGSAVFILDLNPGGTDWIKNAGNPRIVVAGGGGALIQVGADSTQSRVYFQLDVDIEVTPGATATVNGEMAGDDLGTVTMGTTLYFE
jgi:hypothetical protein